MTLKNRFQNLSAINALYRLAINLFFILNAYLIAGERPLIKAHFTDETIVIDGELNENTWLKIDPEDKFTQRLPNDGSEPSEFSEMKIAYNAEFLYFGFVFYDKNPELIRATILNRGGWLHRDDKVEIALDTYYDRRNAYLFEINPLGTQDDALITDERRPSGDDWAWDGVYFSQGKITDQGWVMEVAIPWTTLSFPEDEELKMGLAVKRYINRKNESVIWPHIGLEYASDIYQVSQYGTLTGLKHLKQGKNLKIKPFVLGGTQTEQEGERPIHSTIKTAGVNLYYGLKSNLTLNLTYNTDFAQVEADNVKINLSRFDLFYPEKREFFLERSKLFAFGSPREAELFFSRNIGHTQDVLGGGRLYGQAGRFSVGVLNIHTRGDGDELGTSYSVFRLRTDILTRSSIGAIATNVSTGGETNSALGLDGQMRFWGSSSVNGWIAGLTDSALKHSVFSGNVNLGLRNDRYFLDLGYTNIEQGFTPKLGFVRRTDIIRKSARLGFTPRIGSGDNLIRQLRFHIGGKTYNNQEGLLINSTIEGEISAVLESRDRLGIALSQEMDHLEESFFLKPEVEIVKGRYVDRRLKIYGRSSQNRRIFGNIQLDSGDFYSGSRIGVRGSLGMQFSNHLTIYGNLERSKVDLPMDHGQFTAQVFGLTVEAALNRQWFGKAFIQYDNFSNIIQAYWRINWIHTPGSDLFIVFNSSYLLKDESSFNPHLQNQAKVIKLTYLFQL